MELGNKLKVTIIRLNDQGEGIAKEDGKIIFIPKTFVGEKVLIEIIEVKKHFNRGRLLEILTPSENRGKSECKYFDLCGGCNLLHLSEADMKEFKCAKVLNSLKRFADLDVKSVDLVTGDRYHYRNKITLKVKGNLLGYYKVNSHDILPIDYCYLADEKINNVLPKINELIKNNKHNLTEIILRVADDKILINFMGEIEVDLLKTNFPDVDALYLNNKLINGESIIEFDFIDKKFYMTPISFFQINYKVSEKMFNKISKYLNKEDNVLDLYAGMAAISMVISDKVNAVLAVESNDKAVRSAEELIEINNLRNIMIKNSEVERFMMNTDLTHYNAVIVDPPRKGLDKIVVSKINEIKPKKIIYVSCDPITLARDLKEFIDNGYEVKDITCFDMFSNTYHVETVVYLEVI